MGPVIIVFAKAPLAGRVKTRLLPRVSPQAAAALHTAFVRDTLELVAGLTGIATAELHTDIPTDAWSDLSIPRRLQPEGDLGFRMHHALSAALRRGHTRALILGSDSPTLPASHLRDLLALDADIALGPTRDGGYYAIAVRQVDAEMFGAVRWSTPCTLGDTLSACERCGLSTALGPGWFDVDDGADLDTLRASGSLPRHTAAAMAGVSFP